MFVSHKHIEQTKAEKMKTNILKENKKTARFIRYQHKCSCKKELCEAFGLNICPTVRVFWKLFVER